MLAIESFNRSGDGRQHWCRDCFRSYFRRRGDTHRQQVAATAPARRRRSRAHALSLFADARCADCRLDDPVVLEFDHVGPKRADVSRLVAGQYSRSRLAEEVEACEIVCVSCHRRRTATRAGWFRATGRPGRLWTRAQLRNHLFLVDALRAAGCRDCAADDPVILDFDHRSDKRANVSTMASWASLETLRREVAKCDVRCANCHRRRTLAAVGSYRLAAVESVSPP